MSEQEKLQWAWMQGWNNWSKLGRYYLHIPYRSHYYGAFMDGYRARENAEAAMEKYGIESYHFLFEGERMRRVKSPSIIPQDLVSAVIS